VVLNIIERNNFMKENLNNIFERATSALTMFHSQVNDLHALLEYNKDVGALLEYNKDVGASLDVMRRLLESEMEYLNGLIKLRKIDKIIIHCSDTPENVDVTAADIDKWHKERGFKGIYQGKVYHIGYHHFIRKNGEIELGRPIEIAGEHCKGHNAHSIGICIEGGRDKDGKIKDTRTLQQKQALYWLVTNLVVEYGLEILKYSEKMFEARFANIYGHNELNPNKECPCFDVGKEFRE